MDQKTAEKIAKLPKYTVREELGNTISHFIGFCISIVAFVAMMTMAIINTVRDSSQFVDIFSALLMGGSLILLYTNSTLYHNEKNMEKRINRQKGDHMSISVLIAGSASAYLISGLSNNYGYIAIGLIWFISLVSIFLNRINVKKFRAPTMVSYIVTGWIPIFFAPMIIEACTWGCFWCLLAGGLFYTFGLIFYAIKKEFMHCAWHCFVLAGSICHILGAIIYIF